MAASPFQKPGRRHNRLRVEQCYEEPPPIRVFFSVFSAGDAAEPFDGFTDEDISKVESTLAKFPDVSQIRISSPVVPAKKLQKVGNPLDRTPNPLSVESVISNDADNSAISFSSDASISLTSTKSRQVKASLRLKEADSDFLFTLNSSKRSKASKTIGAILNSGAASPLVAENNSLPTQSKKDTSNKKDTPCVRSKHDEELLERGEAIDISLPPKTQPDGKATVEDEKETKPRVEVGSVSPSKVDAQNVLSRSYKRAKAVKSLADTTTNDVSETSCSQTEKFDGSLSENVISSTSNDILPSSTSEINVKDKFLDLKGRDDDFVSSSNIPDIETSTVESSEQDTATDDSTVDDSMVSVDTHRVKSQIDSELLKLGISEKDFIRVVLRNDGFDSFRAMIGPVVKWELCSNFVRKTFLTIWMWLQTSSAKKIKQFNCRKSSSPGHKDVNSRLLKNEKRVSDGSKIDIKEEPFELPLEADRAAEGSKDETKPRVPGPKESFSSIISKRLTRARIFGSPAKAAEERKSMHIDELYRELPLKKATTTTVPKTETSKVTCKSETSKIAERFAKSIKKKSLAKPLAKVTKKKNKVGLKKLDVDLTVTDENKGSNKEGKIQTNDKAYKSEDSALVSVPTETEHLDKYLSTSPSVDNLENTSFDSLRAAGDPKSSSDLPKLASRTKNVSRKDCLVLEPNSIRVPSKLRLTALEDVSDVVTEVELPLDENEEFEPGKKWIPQPVIMFPPKDSFESPAEDVVKKRKRRTLTPSVDADGSQSTDNVAPISSIPTKPDRSPPAKRKSGGSTKSTGSKGPKGTANEEIDLRLADDEMSTWVSRLTIGGLGQMIDALQLTRLELKNAFSDTASSSLKEPCGLCDCCAMDLQCNECAACVNGEMLDPKINIKCPFKLCLFHIMLKYIRKQLEPTFNLIDYTNLWIRNRKVELLVHNILFLRKCITTLSPSKLNPAKNDHESLKESNQVSFDTEIISDLPSSSEKKPPVASNMKSKKPVESSATPNIFALLGQKLASSRKRPASSSEAKSSACKSFKQLTVNIEDSSQLDSSVLNVESTNQLGSGPKDALMTAESSASEPVESSDGVSEVWPSVRSQAFDDDDGEMLIVETVEVEVCDQQTGSKRDNRMQVYIPPKLLNGVKSCGEEKGCNGGNGTGNGGKMTLRSSPDGVLEMGGSSGFGSGGGGDSNGLAAGNGGNLPPPDSPDSKYWCFAAAAASAEHNQSVRLSVDFPDYHYADRNYLHKHGLPVIGTQGLPVASQCLICASAGQDPLLYCSVCCDPFHVYCIDRKYRPPSIESAYNWVCRSCFACRVCGQGSKLLECFICLRHYHLDCLPAEFYESDMKGRGMSSTWKCPQCSKCESCSGIPETEITLNGVTHALCRNCFSKIDMGDYCHICLRVFSDDLKESTLCDENTPIGENKSNGKTNRAGRVMRADEQLEEMCEKIKCVNCNRWNHKACENMTNEHCQLARLMNSRAKAAHAAEAKSAEGEASSASTQKPLISFKYRCQICSSNYNNIAPWTDKILYFLRMSVKAIIVSLLRSKCALHLVAIKSPSPHSILSLNDVNRNAELVGGNSKAGYVGLRALTTKVKTPENSFKTIEEFRNDVEEIVKKSVHMQPELMMNTWEFCQLFQKEMKKMFPFYGGDQIAPREFLPDVKKTAVSMDIIKHVNSGLFTAIMNEHSYFPNPKSTEAVSESKLKFNNLLDEDCKLVTENSKPKPSAESESTSSGSGFHDRRSCQLCMSKGDRPEKLEGRLLYCGQDDWVHVNCALWSSEVDESHTGAASLHHVFAAIHRGRSMRCAFCQEHGATVGCAAEYCSVQYHFTCARQTNCVFCTNGNTFCLQHKVHAVGLNVVKDFRVRRRVQVDLEEIRWKKSNSSSNNHSNSNQSQLISMTALSSSSNSTSMGGSAQSVSAPSSSEENKNGLLIGATSSNSVTSHNNSQSQLPARDVKVQVGSLSLRNLGSSHLSALSDTPTAIMPVSLKTTRLFWSTKDPLSQTLYRLTISETSPHVDLDKDNHTTSTSEEQMKNRQRRNSDPSCNSTSQQHSTSSENVRKIFSQNSLLKRSSSCHELTALKDDDFSYSTEMKSQTPHTSFSSSYFKDYLKFRSLNSFLQRQFQLFYSKVPKNKRSLSCPLCGKTISPTTWTQTHYKTCNELSSLYFSQFKNSVSHKLKRSKWNFSSQNTGSFHGASKLGDSNESIMVQILLQKIEGDPETTSMEKTIQQIQSCINNHNRLSSSRTPKLKFHLESDDGFEIQSNSLLKVWTEVYRQVWECKAERGLLRDDIIVGSYLSRQDNVDPLRLAGLSLDGVSFLLEQLPSAKFCSRYKFKFFNLKVQHIPVNPSGCARSEARKDTRTLIGRRDMFSWLSSKNRFRPTCDQKSMADLETQLASLDRRKTNAELPLPLRYRSLKKTAKSMCAVFRSDIHGRGLFSLQTIFPDEMIIEYTGELIRCTLTDKREKFYQSKGIGCYMFRMDKKHVIDATVSGNAARFINHSCDPNCYSRVLVAENRKHIVIFASRLILKGEELTYDYKFDIEDESSKLECHCGTTNCKKYLN